MNTALVCVGLLGILLFGMGFVVSIARGRADRVIGYDDAPTDPLHKAIRAHGNTAEYAAMLAVLIFVVGSRDPGTWATICMIGATASRYLIAIGLLTGATLAKPHPLRFVGALGTYVFGLGLCGELLRSL
ncbi:MAG: MAPEG family protein [Myxococcota bacterium]|nr:MAPEG family protein [Myxococcota bacterium]